MGGGSWSTQMEALPLVLLGPRTTFKPHLNGSAAELVSMAPRFAFLRYFSFLLELALQALMTLRQSFKDNSPYQITSFGIHESSYGRVYSRFRAQLNGPFSHPARALTRSSDATPST